MDDRKRPLNEDDGPPPKRHASSTNGEKKIDRDADMPWKDDLERFQKDAIFRQMQEFKREKNTLEGRVNDLIKRTVYHDDHLRIVDAWWSQLLDDVKVLAGKSDDLAEGGARIPASLLSGPNGVFQEHLQSRSQAIQSTLSALFSSLPPTSSPDVSELQGRLSTLLAAEKGHQMELERVQTERDNLVERLETASLRYMIAEKKLDRAKSAAIAKLERAGTMGGNNDTGSGGSGGADKMANGAVANGTTDHAKANSQLETARGAAVAVMDKQKEQLEKLEAENQGLTGQVTDLTVKLSNLNDDDYTRSDVFKHLKSQYEDVIKRINGLEATNLELRQEAEKLQAERTAYKVQVESEVQASVEEVQSELERVQNDLARIRATRDELQNVMMVNKASQGTETAAYAQIRELAAAREDRIIALESELERARIKIGETPIDAVVRPDLERMSEDDLRKRYHSLEREYALLSNELPSLGAAWKKASALASKKVNETAASQERMARLQAEKVKADQKYFAQMKLNESKQMELQALRRQNAQSAEVIAQLKDAEKATRALVVNLEKQIAETKEAITTLTTQNNALHQQVVHTSISTDSTKAQMGDLVSMMRKKDAALSTALKSQRQAEREAEHLKVMLAESKKTATDLQAAAAGNVNHEFEALHTLAYCNICRSRLVNTAIKLCGHTFCRECIDVRLRGRERKCPTCSKMFATTDVIPVHL